RAGPGEILMVAVTILVDVVLVADIEWRVGENQIDGFGLEAGEALNAVALAELIAIHWLAQCMCLVSARQCFMLFTRHSIHLSSVPPPDENRMVHLPGPQYAIKTAG